MDLWGLLAFNMPDRFFLDKTGACKDQRESLNFFLIFFYFFAPILTFIFSILVLNAPK